MSVQVITKVKVLRRDESLVDIVSFAVPRIVEVCNIVIAEVRSTPETVVKVKTTELHVISVVSTNEGISTSLLEESM